jgi:glycerol-3-phosphate dehydrogenase
MIHRNPSEAATRSFDLIIVGGGIYGIALSYVAARAGLRPLLLEQGDFAHATSLNHLRIVHGGFRYLQNLDLHRFRESVAERRWFLAHFAGLVRPLSCMMPLYNRGIYRTSVLRLALGMNDFLSRRRNDGVPAVNHLADGRIVSRAEALAIFPGLIAQELRGAAIWQDATVDDPQRMYVEWLRHSCRLGAVALNYNQATELCLDAGQACGVLARDLVDGTTRRFQAPIVVNAAGP